MLTELDWKIIQVYADNNMSINATANTMYMHVNSVSYHLNKVFKETNLNPRRFCDLVKLLNISRVEKAVEQISKELFRILVEDD